MALRESFPSEYLAAERETIRSMDELYAAQKALLPRVAAGEDVDAEAAVVCELADFGSDPA